MLILLNWLWQGAALTALVTLALATRRRMSASTRERIWWATLAAVAAMPLVGVLRSIAVGVLSPIPAAGAMVEPVVRLPVATDTWMVVLGIAWTAWLFFSVVRIGCALRGLRQTKQTAAPFPADREARLTVWREISARGRQARLLVSHRVQIAAVLGLKDPAIVVAPDALERLTDTELEYVLVHEHAHIQRRDDLAVLLQAFVRAGVGLHPAVWWLDRALTFEREAACDDRVTTRLGSARQYAASLVKLAEHGAESRGHLELAPGALLTRSELTRRVTRLLDADRNVSVRPSRVALRVAVPAVAAVAALAAAVELVGAPIEWVPVTARQYAGWLPGPVAVHGTAILEVRPSAQAVAGRRQHTQEIGPSTDTTAPPAGGGQPGQQPGPVVFASLELIDPPALRPVQLEAEAGASPALAGPNEPEPPGPAGPSVATGASAGEPTPWGATAEMANAIGRGSREGAVKTAGFFTRISKAVAGAF